MKQIISSIIYLIALLCISVFIFDPTSLYYELPWLDIPMHILGGFGVISLAFSIANYKGKKLSFTSIIAIYCIVAIGWELYELTGDLMSHATWNGWSDTASDFINGFIGVIIAQYFLKK